MPKIRIACYIDGFNIYHAIDNASRSSRGRLNYLKWVNLRSLMEEFTDLNIHEVVTVKLFTAYPHWRTESTIRHKNYVSALEHYGVEVILGRFKRKDTFCKICENTFKAREEKESDVNIAVHLVGDAHQNKFDQAFLVTADSDLIGPVRHVLECLPDKKVKIICPPFRKHSKDLTGAATNHTKIQQIHLEKNLLPESVTDINGMMKFKRPSQYDPPA